MQDHDDVTMRSLQFLMTEDCNLNCVYCYEKNKTKKKLSAAFIKERIRDEMLEENNYTELSVDFFGGEPLIAFDTIKEVVEWFHRVEWPDRAKAYRFAITTNGTLLDDARKEWFSRYKDVVTLCLSLDGTRKAHNRNRCNSYDTVAQHFDFFRENWPRQPVKMTISNFTLEQMYEGIVHIHRQGFEVEANICFEDVWGDAESKKLALRTYADQLERLVYFYRRNPHLRRPRLINKNIMSLYDRRHVGDNMFCGAGTHLVCWTGTAQQYPCMRFAPISTARPLAQKSEQVGEINQVCANCPFERLCPTCEGHNYEVTGSSYQRTDFHCDFFRLEMLAAARLLFLENYDEVVRGNLPVRTEEENLNCLRRILAIRTIDDVCRNVIDEWPVVESGFEPPYVPPPDQVRAKFNGRQGQNQPSAASDQFSCQS